jgi:hypothetical protein
MRIAEPGGAGTSFLVSIGVRTRDGATAQLGTVSLFPVGEPGRFTLPLRGEAGSGLAANGGTVTLTLEPVSADRPLPDGLEVEVTEVGLSTTPAT